MPQNLRITQKDVARIAGVNRATVSLAIRNHPSIPLKTCERIQRIALDLNYRIDPMLSALAAYRHAGRPSQYRGTLAWIARSTGHFRWQSRPHFATYLESARERAEFHGYRLDVFDLGEQQLSLTRLTSILRSRGIHGLMLCPQPFPDTDLSAIPWGDFSAVTFGHSVTAPLLHSVAAAQFRAAFRCVKEMLDRGYRRIGLSISDVHDKKTDHNFLGGFLAAINTLPTRQRITPHIYDQTDPSSESMLVKWIHRTKPDALVLSAERFAEVLAQHGIQAPRDIGIACPLLNSPDSPVSGVWETNHRLGEAAVDMLVSMLHRGERGIPEMPSRLMVEGQWVPGQTLRE